MAILEATTAVHEEIRHLYAAGPGQHDEDYLEASLVLLRLVLVALFWSNSAFRCVSHGAFELWTIILVIFTRSQIYPYIKPHVHPQHGPTINSTVAHMKLRLATTAHSSQAPFC